MSKLPKILPFFFVLALFLARPLTRAEAAATVYFDPSSVTVSQNGEFTVLVKVGAEANQVIGSDAIVLYAGADLDVTSVTNGTYFPELTWANNDSAGRLEIHGYVTSTDQSKTGTGTLASVKFTSKKASGSSTLSLSCAASGNETNLLNLTGANILSCGQVNQVAVSYIAGGATNTPTPTTVPGSANTLPYCASLTSDVTAGTGAPLAVTFTCAGVDPGGDITAASFIFGDGTSLLVEKNVGSPGSLTTMHTYTTIGTLGASCRVRDNDQAFSTTVDACRRIITIRPKPTDGVTSITPTPTAAIVSIIEETPAPTPEETPFLYPEEEVLVEGETTPNRFWWIVGGAVSLILAFILLRKRNPPAPPASPIPPAPPQYPS